MTPSCATAPRSGATDGGSTNAYASGQSQPRKRRSEQDAGNDFADDRRLADAAEHEADKLAERNDQRKS